MCRQAILSSMPMRSVIGSTPLASQSVDIGDYCSISIHIVIYSDSSTNDVNVV